MKFLSLLVLSAVCTAAPVPDDASQTPVGMICSQYDIDQAMRFHNDARSAAGKNPLTWSDDLASDAAALALRCAQEERLDLASGSSSNASANGMFMPGSATLADGAQFIANSGAGYQAANNSQGQEFYKYASYRQMIWGATTEVGMGLAQGGNRTYWIAYYSPPGNAIGESP